MRLSIEITPDQHQRLKAAAALKGESIKDYVLKRTLPNPDEQSALQELEQIVSRRDELQTFSIYSMISCLSPHLRVRLDRLSLLTYCSY